MIIRSLLALQSQTTLAIICAIWFLRASEYGGDRRPDLSLDAWRRLSTAEECGVEAEAISLPLPGLNGPITVRWSRLAK